MEQILPFPRTVVLGTTAALLFFGALLSLPEQAPDFCLSPDRSSDLCYCEAFHDGLVRQPSNTLSSIAFPAVGLAILWRTPKITPGARALFHRDKRLHVLWALSCIVLGAASAAFHATFVVLTGLFDSFAILAWLSLFTAYHLGRAFMWRANRILAVSVATPLTLFALSVASLVLAPGTNGPHLIGEVTAGAATFSPLLC
ncbi:MAG TPA: hypothetical protein VM580_35100, partial [Labilithrix sp.]|nr:hypothetical protein [Labilithrix sp.]